MNKLRQEIYDVIRDDDQNKLSGTIFDSIIIVFILVNTVFIVLDTFHFVGRYQAFSSIIESIATFVFTIEYILRIWTAPLNRPKEKPTVARIKYIFSPMAAIDLLSILPSFLPFFLSSGLKVIRGLRIIRLMRIFKANRYNDAFTIIGRVFRKKARQLLSSTFVVFLLMLIASMMMYDIENAAQPDKFDNAFSAFWWAMATVTTVGYGDLYPITTIGKIIGGLIAFLGIGLVAVPTGIISAGFIEENQALEREHAVAFCEPKTDRTANSMEKSYCPYCGQKLD